MSPKAFSLTAGGIFLLIAIGHLVRIILGASFVVEGTAIPMWASVVAAIFTAYLAFEGFRLARKA